MYENFYIQWFWIQNSSFNLQAESAEEISIMELPHLNVPHPTDTNSSYDRKTDLILYTGEVCQVYGTWSYSNINGTHIVNIDPSLGGTRTFSYQYGTEVCGIARYWYRAMMSTEVSMNISSGGCATIDDPTPTPIPQPDPTPTPTPVQLTRGKYVCLRDWETQDNCSLSWNRDAMLALLGITDSTNYKWKIQFQYTQFQEWRDISNPVVSASNHTAVWFGEPLTSILRICLLNDSDQTLDINGQPTTDANAVAWFESNIYEYDENYNATTNTCDGYCV